MCRPSDYVRNSVHYIMNEALSRCLISVHYRSKNFLMAVIGLHMAQAFSPAGKMRAMS